MVGIKIFLLNIFLLFSFFAYSWQRQSISYEPAQYDGGTQNWQIKQSAKGWLYFANNNGLLEFDGYTWTHYTMQNRIVRAIKFADKRIYAGGSNVFGYYQENENGELVFHSLNKQLGNDWKGDIWSVYIIEDKVYYIDDHNVYVYQNDQYLHTVTSSYKIDSSIDIDKKIYIGTPDGIAYLKPNSIKFENTTLIDKINPDKNYKIVEFLQYKDRLVVVTAHSGIFMVNDKECSKIKTVADDFISKNQLFCASIDNNMFAIGSVLNGLLLLDFERPEYYEIISQNNILKNNTVLSCFFDKDKNLWIGLDNGICFINMNESISPLFTKESPIGTGYCSAFYNNVLYLGTNQGLYTLDKEDVCSLVNGTQGQIISLVNHYNVLFCCGDNGLLVVDGNEQYFINIQGISGIYPIPQRSDQLIAATYFGLKLLEKRNNRWYFARDIDGFVRSSRGGLTFYKDFEYWQANPGDNHVNKFIFDGTFRSVKIEKYKIGNTRISNNSAVTIIDNNPVVCTENGIYRFSDTDNKFVAYTELENLLEGTRNYQYLFIDKMKNIWYKTNGILQFLPHSDNRFDHIKYYIGLESQMPTGEENIMMLDSIRAIIGTYKGFSLVRTDKIQELQSISEVYIRGLKAIKDTNVTSYGRTSKEIELPYGYNTISFTWGGFNSSSQGEVLFSYRLDGLDDDWSKPTAKHIKEYTNLKEGKYSFEVRASIKNQGNVTISSDKITFYILPPWYRSTWAYAIYFLLIVGLLFVFYKVITRKKERIIGEKKKTIAYQQLLMKEEARMKDKKIYELEKEKLTSDLQHKSIEMTGYILDINRKNEMFDKIKKESGTVLKLIDEKGDNLTIRKKISDLIVQINNNLKHNADFDIFKSNFDYVHRDFFKILETKFPQLTKKDKILCAYIKMELVSKEIAPLLNISVRGVEINRYNLRKKMNLDRNVNFAEFLNNLTED